MSLFKPYRFRTKEQIEHLANDILSRMQVTPNYAPKWPLDPTRVAEFLGLDVEWVSLPPDDEAVIAATIWPLERKIYINENNQKLPEGFEESSIAHEIGHWVLHVNQDEADGCIHQMELAIGGEQTEQQFLCRSLSEQIFKSNTKNQLESREWQAQYFASCLLMPRHILEKKRKGRDLTKWPHLYAIRDELGVTISNLTNRLQDLGWIHISKGNRQIYPGSTPPNGQGKLF